jgi:hypothetical protein
MSITTALLVLSSASVVSFKGGDDADLVKFLGENSPRTFVAIIDGERRWGPFSVVRKSDRVTLREFSERGRIVFKFDPDPSLNHTGVDIDYWPLYLHQNKNETRLVRGYDLWQIPKTFRIGSALRTDRKHVDLPALSNLYGRRLSWHSVFNHVRLSVSSPTSAPDDLLPSVALALGAKLTNRDGMYRLEPDATEFKRRMSGLTNFVKRRQARGPALSFPTVVGFTGACYRSATVAQVQALLDGKLEIKLAVRDNTEIGNWANLKVQEAHQRDHPSVKYLANQDPEKPTEAWLRLWRGELRIWFKPTADFPKGNFVVL